MCLPVMVKLSSFCGAQGLALELVVLVVVVVELVVVDACGSGPRPGAILLLYIVVFHESVMSEIFV